MVFGKKYPHNMSRTKYKKSFRFFWTKRWKYERTPEEWAALCQKRGLAKVLLMQALEKLSLEKKVTPEEKKSLTDMLNSTDSETIVLAVHVMARLKPKKFKR